MRIITVLALSMFILTGLLARVESDDYCVAGLHYADFNGSPRNPISYTFAMYTVLGGRYSQLVLQSSIAYAEPLANMLMPAVLILATVGLLTLLLRSVDSALLLTLALYAALPDKDGTLFWLSGSMTYIAPLLLSAAAGLFILHRRSLWWAFALGLWAGAFSESTTLMLVWLPLTFYRPLRRALPYWWIGLAIAFIVMVSAPGNALRAAHFPPPDFWRAWRNVSEWMLTDGLRAVLVGLPGYVLAFSAGLTLPVAITRRQMLTAWAVCLVCAAGVMFSVGYAAGDFYRPERVLTLPVCLLCGACWLTGCYAAVKRKRNPPLRYGVMVLVVCIGLMMALGLPGRFDYARAWDNRHATLLSGVTEVKGIPGRWDTLNQAAGYVHHCASQWYAHPVNVQVLTKP